MNRCGLHGFLVQYDEPLWEPLLRVVGERLTGTFMWMDEEEMEDGTRLQAYKHIHTRRYLYLTEEGKAFKRAPCGRFCLQRLDFALEYALCGWWVLSGWEAEDAEAVRKAILDADRTTGILW